jgi:hypothetical protein
MEGMEPYYLLIYPIIELQSQALKAYIDKNLERGFIRLSESLAGYSTLFVLKKDGENRLYVNYRKLNDITIKNRYLLPLQEEIRTYIGKVKIFTKVDIREVYY